MRQGPSLHAWFSKSWVLHVRIHESVGVSVCMVLGLVMSMCVRSCVECWSVRGRSYACGHEWSSESLTDAGQFTAIVCICNTLGRTCRAITTSVDTKNPVRYTQGSALGISELTIYFSWIREPLRLEILHGNPSRRGCMPSCQLQETRHDHSRDGRNNSGTAKLVSATV